MTAHSSFKLATSADLPPSPSAGVVGSDLHAPAIEIEALAVLAEVRVALTQMIDGLAKPVRRAVDLERTLGLDKKLAWQVFRVAHASDPHAEVQNLPASSSIRRLLAAARKHSVSDTIITRLNTAFDKFDAFTHTHARDRESLVSMLNGLGGKRDDQFELRVRKSLFRAASHVWGLHCRMVVRTGIFHAKPGPNYIEDGLAIQASIGLERVRVSQATDMVVAMRTVRGPAASNAAATVPVQHPPEMLEQFCTGPLPSFSPYPEGESRGETKLRLPPGRTGAATLYTMHLHENIATERQHDYFGRTLLTTPTEEMVWELLVPVGWTVPTTLRAAMYGCREKPEQAFSEQACDLMPQQETAEYLGALEHVPALSGSPSHSEAVEHVLRRMGWLGTRFDIYRCRVQYPIMHTLLSLRADAQRA